MPRSTSKAAPRLPEGRAFRDFDSDIADNPVFREGYVGTFYNHSR